MVFQITDNLSVVQKLVLAKVSENNKFRCITGSMWGEITSNRQLYSRYKEMKRLFIGSQTSETPILMLKPVYKLQVRQVFSTLQILFPQQIAQWKQFLRHVFSVDVPI